MSSTIRLSDGACILWSSAFNLIVVEHDYSSSLLSVVCPGIIFPYDYATNRCHSYTCHQHHGIFPHTHIFCVISCQKRNSTRAKGTRRLSSSVSHGTRRAKPIDDWMARRKQDLKAHINFLVSTTTTHSLMMNDEFVCSTPLSLTKVHNHSRSYYRWTLLVVCSWRIVVSIPIIIHYCFRRRLRIVMMM